MFHHECLLLYVGNNNLHTTDNRTPLLGKRRSNSTRHCYVTWWQWGTRNQSCCAGRRSQPNRWLLQSRIRKWCWAGFVYPSFAKHTESLLSLQDPIRLSLSKCFPNDLAPVCLKSCRAASCCAVQTNAASGTWYLSPHPAALLSLTGCASQPGQSDKGHKQPHYKSQLPSIRARTWAPCSCLKFKKRSLRIPLI